MSTTIDDIAKACGLSRTTVSRVLQNSPNVGAKTRQKVEKAIKEFGYRPNQTAQSLARGYSNTVALIVGNISSSAQIEIAKVIQKGLYPQNLMVWLCNSDYDTTLCNSYLDTALASKLAGTFLITCDASADHLIKATESGMPIVFINRQNLAVSCDSIYGDDQKAAFQATEHLIALGHRNIILLSVSQSLISGRNAYWGFRTAMEMNGLPFSDEHVYEIDISSYSDALKTRRPFNAEDLFQNHPETTAIVCLSNEVAVEFYSQCKALGKEIPKDLSMISLDPVQANTIPGVVFTSFGADQNGLGLAAVTQMLERIQGRKGTLQNNQSLPGKNIVLNPVYNEGNTVSLI